MSCFRRIIFVAISLWIACTTPSPVWADGPAEAAAARYIRTLFDATLHDGADLTERCTEIAALGRFGAGRLWHALSEPEKTRFDHDFCALINEAAGRVRTAFPGLELQVSSSLPAPQDRILLHSVVTRSGTQEWPVDWLIADLPAQPHVVDLKILGISLGIFLRGLAATQWPDGVPASLTAAEIQHPWRLALDRALPPR